MKTRASNAANQLRAAGVRLTEFHERRKMAEINKEMLP
jgi:hypothetical protein